MKEGPKRPPPSGIQQALFEIFLGRDEDLPHISTHRVHLQLLRWESIEVSMQLCKLTVQDAGLRNCCFKLRRLRRQARHSPTHKRNRRAAASDEAC